MSQYSGSRKVNNFGAVILYILFCLFFFLLTQLHTWMLKIDPDCPVTARRLRTLIESAVKRYSKLADRQRTNLAWTNFVCDCLSALGVTRKTISSPPLKFHGLSISNL